ITGFETYEYSIAAKWLELLKQIAPGLVRIAVLRNPATPSGGAQFGAIQSVARTFEVQLSPVGTGSREEIERGIVGLAREPNSGLIVTSNPLAAIQRDLILTLAIKHRLPAIYPSRFYAAGGGLVSYGADNADQYRQAADYIDRILKGEKP